MPTKKITDKYIEAIGRRKTAVARVRVYLGGDVRTVNDLSFKDYFKLAKLATTALSPLTIADFKEKLGITVHVKGSGLSAQAEAVRHGLSRVLVKINPELRAILKASDVLTRDARAVERKKPGLKKARRAPQWQKR